MSLQYTTAIRDAFLTTLNNALGNSARLLIYTGSPPATLAQSPTGTLLSSGLRGNAAGWGTITAGVITARAFTPDVNVLASGNAGYFRWVDASNNAVYQGTITNPSGNGDLKLSQITLAAGDTLTIASWVITAPGA